MTNNTLPWVLAFLMVTHLGMSRCLTEPQTVNAPRQDKESESKWTPFTEFLDRIQSYADLRNSLREGIPRVHRKDKPEQIQKHQQLLAQRIQQARKNTIVGDVFTPDSKNAFRQVIKALFSGEHARDIDRTIVQGEPVKLALYVNKPYPQRMPVTTVPPSLLQDFPKLPKGIEYRVVGTDLVLHDVESDLVVDIFPDAFPNAPPH